MKNTNYFKYILIGGLSLAFASCEDEYETNSVVQSFAPVAITMSPETSPVVYTESLEEDCEFETTDYTFTYFLDENQIYDEHVVIGVGESSTATEGEDFELITHDVDLVAFEGRKGFDVTVRVFGDLEMEEQEEIFLTLTGSNPAVTYNAPAEFKVLTLNDNGVSKTNCVSMTLSWEFTDASVTEDACAVDIDLTIETAGTAPYDGDALGYDLSTTDCPEEGVLGITELANGVVYQMRLIAYGSPGLVSADMAGMTVTIELSRGGTELSTVLEINDVITSEISSDGAVYVVYTIVRNGDTITIKDADGNVVAQG